MALYLLNCCIDAPDAHNRWKQESLAYNEQESVIEIVVESVLGFGDVIAEYDDADPEDDYSLKKNIALDLFLVPEMPSGQAEAPETALAFNPVCKNLNPQEFARYFNPPPEL